MKREKSCGALVFRQLGETIEFLLIRHRKGGHWSFPKGHVELGETEKETALREVLEETGLSVSILPNFREKVSYSPKSGVYKDVIYFLAIAGQNDKIVLQVEEVSDARWVNSDNLSDKLTHKNDKFLAKKAELRLNEYKN